MSIHAHILHNSENIKPFAVELKSVTKHVDILIKKIMPVGVIDVVFYNNPEGTIKETGIGGYTPVANTVFISLNPSHPKFKKIFKEEVFYTLVHEINHAIRFRTPIPKETLFEAIISEGIADHFAMEVTGIKKPPAWCTALHEDQKKKLLKRASKEWDLSGYAHEAWFYGSVKKNIPRWAAYTLGYDLVASYLEKHPKISASKLTSAKASIFI